MHDNDTYSLDCDGVEAGVEAGVELVWQVGAPSYEFIFITTDEGHMYERTSDGWRSPDGDSIDPRKVRWVSTSQLLSMVRDDS